MKAILMSIRPPHVCNILNLIKLLEIRKKFPKDYVGWVYIYCTKGGQGLVWDDEGKGLVNSKLFPYAKNCPEHNRLINGKVVARFWCDKVDKVHLRFEKYCAGELSQDGLLKYACLTEQELYNYLWSNWCIGYAIHITKLEIFDEPKELWRFKTLKNAKEYKEDLEWAIKEDAKISARMYEGIANDDECDNCVELTEMSEGYYGLQKAPQSWCFIEV